MSAVLSDNEIENLLNALSDTEIDPEEIPKERKSAIGEKDMENLLNTLKALEALEALDCDLEEIL